MIMLLLCVALLLAACGSESDDSGKKDSKKDNKKENASVTETIGTPTITPEDKPFSITLYAAETDKLVKEAVAQVKNGDYTPLDEPVKYNVLWLGFTHVTFGELDFQMTDFDREYLQAVALNFEQSVEEIANHNVDIMVELHFVDDVTPLTQASGADWLYLAQETVQSYIDSFLAGREFDTVLTTVQTDGDENRERNEDKDGYGVHDVMLGLETANMSMPIGYSTFNLTKPREGTYPLADPKVPSLYATAVAVHEWMHQLEPLATLLGIEYPNTHAYQGPDAFPGYQKYIADANDYDYFEFYKLVLQGKLPYTGAGDVQYVGMYPAMWRLIKRNVFNAGEFTIKAADGQGYLTGQASDPTLTLSDSPCVWTIRYNGDGRLVLSPKELPDKLIDLGNAWDTENNTISLWVYTGYVDAQSWRMPDAGDGCVYIQTPYASGRVLTAHKGQQALLCTIGADGVQKWIVEPYKDPS